jgi:ABC-2 type transport system permease protein
MQQLRHIWFIALKDLKLFVTDRQALFFFIVFPFLFIILFNFLLGGTGGEDERLELHLVTREAEGISHQIIGAMETTDETSLGPGEPKIVWDKDYEAAREAVANEQLAGFIAFPADFTPSLADGTGADIEVVVNPDNVNTRAALGGLAEAIAAQLATYRVIINANINLLMEAGLLPPDEASINQAAGQIMADIFASQAAGERASLIAFATEKVGEVEAENPANYVIPGYLVMFVFFAAVISAESIVRERQNNTLERLLATSVRRSSLLGGIFTGTVIRGLVQIAIFWVVGILVFKVDMGLSPLAVIILSLLMVVMSSACAVLLATLVRTQRAASSLGVITALALAPLGGCWWPLFLYPDWLQNIARVTPHAWATDGFNNLMVFGSDFASAVPNMLALLGFAVFFGVLAVWRFRTSAV